MHENENTAADNIADPARSRRDPPGTLRDALGRLRVPLDRPDPDHDGRPDHADCHGSVPPRSDDDRARGLPAGSLDEDEVWTLFQWAEDEQEQVPAELRALLPPAQVAALEAVVGMAHAVAHAPFCAEAVEGVVRVGEAALGLTPDDAQDRALHRVRRLVFAHRLVERLLERACIRLISNGWVPAGMEQVASAFNAAYDPDEGTAGAEVVLAAVHRAFPFIADSADKAAQALTRAEDAAPAPTADVGERLGELSRVARSISFNWMALGDDDLGLLDVVLDTLASAGATDGAMGEVLAATTYRAGPRVLSRLPAMVQLFGGDPSTGAGFYGQIATEALLRTAVARAKATGTGADRNGGPTDPEAIAAACSADSSTDRA